MSIFRVQGCAGVCREDRHFENDLQTHSSDCPRRAGWRCTVEHSIAYCARRAVRRKGLCTNNGQESTPEQRHDDLGDESRIAILVKRRESKPRHTQQIAGFTARVRSRRTYRGLLWSRTTYATPQTRLVSALQESCGDAYRGGGVLLWTHFRGV